MGSEMCIRDRFRADPTIDFGDANLANADLSGSELTATAEGSYADATIATTLRAGDRGATFQNYSKTLASTLSRPHPHVHLP